jgi:hypothetical protein
MYDISGNKKNSTHVLAQEGMMILCVTCINFQKLKIMLFVLKFYLRVPRALSRVERVILVII